MERTMYRNTQEPKWASRCSTIWNIFSPAFSHMASVKSFKRKYLKLRKSFDSVVLETEEIEQKIAEISEVYRRILLENAYVNTFIKSLWFYVNLVRRHLNDLLIDMNSTVLPTPPASPPGSPYWEAKPVSHTVFLESPSDVFTLEKPIASTHRWLSKLTALSKSTNSTLSTPKSFHSPLQSRGISPSSAQSSAAVSSSRKQKRKRTSEGPSERRARKK